MKEKNAYRTSSQTVPHEIYRYFYKLLVTWQQADMKVLAGDENNNREPYLLGNEDRNIVNAYVVSMSIKVIIPSNSRGIFDKIF